MNHRKIIIIVIAIAALACLAIALNPKPCGYTNFAWGAQKSDCNCLGVKVDTSCKTPDGQPCPDAGGSTSCVGIVTEKKCYEFKGWEEQGSEAQWDKVICDK